MREVRPYFLHGRQENVIDGKLELEVQKQLALLQQRMRVTGQAFGAHKRILADGTIIIVSASYNGPVPVLRAFVQGIVVGGSDGEDQCTLRFESGLAAEYSVDENGVFTIHLSEKSRDYYLGNGTRFLALTPEEQTKFTHLGNKIQFTGNPCIPYRWVTSTSSPVLSSSFLSELYAPGPDEFFTSPLITALSGAPPNYSSSYTGLMRLAVQAKLGAGKPIADLFAFGVTAFGETGPETDGLIRDEDYNYYVIRITGDDTTGRCEMVRMKTEDRFSELKQRLADGEFSEEHEEGETSDREKAEAILMSSLTRDAAFETEVIFENQDLGLGSPIGYGWHYSHTSPFAAAIVKHRIVKVPPDWAPCYENYATQVIVNFQFVFDIVDELYKLQATIEFPVKDYLWILGYAAKVWNPIAMRTWLFGQWLSDLGRYLAVTCNQYKGPYHAPVYCWFTRDGGLNTIWHNWEADISRTIKSNNGLWCDGGYSSKYESCTAGFYVSSWEHENDLGTNIIEIEIPAGIATVTILSGSVATAGGDWIKSSATEGTTDRTISQTLYCRTMPGDAYRDANGLMVIPYISGLRSQARWRKKATAGITIEEYTDQATFDSVDGVQLTRMASAFIVPFWNAEGAFVVDWQGVTKSDVKGLTSNLTNWYNQECYTRASYVDHVPEGSGVVTDYIGPIGVSVDGYTPTDVINKDQWISYPAQATGADFNHYIVRPSNFVGTTDRTEDATRLRIFVGDTVLEEDDEVRATWKVFLADLVSPQSGLMVTLPQSYGGNFAFRRPNSNDVELFFGYEKQPSSAENLRWIGWE